MASVNAGELPTSEPPKLVSCMRTMAQGPWRANHAWKRLREILATWERSHISRNVLIVNHRRYTNTLVTENITLLESVAMAPALMTRFLQGTDILK